MGEAIAMNGGEPVKNEGEKSAEKKNEVKSIKDLMSRTGRVLAETSREIQILEERHQQEEQEMKEQQEQREKREINVLFALDATYSREHFWELSKDIQASIFTTAMKIKGRFFSQLVFFSGETEGRELKKSPWVNGSLALSDFMEGITCKSGSTQIQKVFRHALDENCNRKIGALVLVSDACEEYMEDLAPYAREIKKAGINFFLLDDSKGSTTPRANTVDMFNRIKDEAGGERIEFFMDNVDALGDMLSCILATSTNDVESVRVVEREAKTPQGRASAQKAIRKMLALPEANL